MTMENDETQETVWTVLTRRAAGPKLEWLKQSLEAEGIPFRLNGFGLQGHVLEVEEGFLHQGWAILQTIVGELLVVSNGRIVWDDLPNNHPLFDVQYVDFDGQALPVSGGLVLPYTDTPGIGIAEASVRMYDVESSNMSALGFQDVGHETANDELRGTVIVFARFKGGLPYRYYGKLLTESVRDDLMEEMKRKAMGLPEASVGSLFHHSIKVHADNGLIKCDRFTDEGRWETVLTKAERSAQKKAKYAAPAVEEVIPPDEALAKHEEPEAILTPLAEHEGPTQTRATESQLVAYPYPQPEPEVPATSTQGTDDTKFDTSDW